MPPKPKITHDEILHIAYELALRKGIGSLSSRNVAHAAGCSVQPIFYQFPTMDCLRQELYQYACRLSAEEVLNDETGQDLLTVLIKWMLDLARNRPNLFEILYLSNLSSPQDLPGGLMRTENHQRMVHKISNIHGITLEESEDVLIRTCLLLMGIGTMICINKVDITEETVMDLMHRTVADFVDGIKAQKAASI